jgi:tRNA pseudouridine55 synthase
MHGVLVIDKPAGPTSFDVVRRVRSLLKVKKVGHTGTLDPAATGVLPVCLGDATRVAGFITEGDKAYDAVVRLGQETDTLDAEGRVVAEAPVPHLIPAQLEAALARFRGTFLQTPPMYSAVKVGGKRLYELARAGEAVERAARQVTVYSLELRDFSATELTLSVRCSKGFFVRTLAQELGRALGCGAHLKSLRRTASGPFPLARAVPLAEVEARAKEGPEGLAAVAARLVPVEEALVEMPRLDVGPEDARRVRHGVPLEVHGVLGRVRVMGPDGALLAVAESREGRRLHYLRVLT